MPWDFFGDETCLRSSLQEKGDPGESGSTGSFLASLGLREEFFSLERSSLHANGDSGDGGG